MKIEVSTNDITTLAKALNNALIGYNEVINCLYLGCDPVASKLRALENTPHEELRKRVDALNGLYLQIEEIERKDQDGMA